MIKVVATDMKYFASSKFSTSLIYNKFWLDMASRLQIITLTLLKEVGYFF